MQRCPASPALIFRPHPGIIGMVGAGPLNMVPAVEAREYALPDRLTAHRSALGTTGVPDREVVSGGGDQHSECEQSENYGCCDSFGFHRLVPPTLLYSG